MYCVLRWNIRSTHWADSKYYICLVRNHWNCPISTQYATCCFTQQTRYAGLTDLITNTINGNLIICRYNNVQRTEICWRHCSKLTRASCDRIADCMDLLTHTTLTFLMHSHQVNVTCVGGGAKQWVIHSARPSDTETSLVIHVNFQKNINQHVNKLLIHFFTKPWTESFLESVTRQKFKRKLTDWLFNGLTFNVNYN